MDTNSSVENVSNHKINQSRGWVFTLFVENEKDDGSIIKYTKEDLIKQLSCYSYVCFGIEKTEKDNLHYQGYIENNNAIKFSTLKNKFNEIHLEKRKGSKKSARDYCLKIGKFSDRQSEQIDKPIELGEFDSDEQGKRTDLLAFKDYVFEGADKLSIIENFPYIVAKYPRFYEELISLRDNNLDFFNRKINVTYIFGDNPIAKMDYIKQVTNDFKDTYIINQYKTDYFNGYLSQSKIVFNNFQGDINMNYFKSLILPYPVELISRFQNKVARYTDVYICSTSKPNGVFSYNDKIHEQLNTEDFNGFIKLLNKIVEIDDDMIYDVTDKY